MTELALDRPAGSSDRPNPGISKNEGLLIVKGNTLDNVAIFGLICRRESIQLLQLTRILETGSKEAQKSNIHRNRNHPFLSPAVRCSKPIPSGLWVDLARWIKLGLTH